MTASIGRLQVLAGLAACLLLSACPAESKKGGLSVTAAGKTSLPAPPWARPLDMAEAVKKAGLELFPTEGHPHHIHARLNVFYAGEPVGVPNQIGIVPGQGVSALHTLDESGTIHIEAPTKRDYTLGQFFAQWQVPLVDVTVTVDGEAVTDPDGFVLRDRQVIELRFREPKADDKDKAPTT